MYNHNGILIKCIYSSVDGGDCLSRGAYYGGERNGGGLRGGIYKLNNRLSLTV